MKAEIQKAYMTVYARSLTLKKFAINSFKREKISISDHYQTQRNENRTTHHHGNSRLRKQHIIVKYDRTSKLAHVV